MHNDDHVNNLFRTYYPVADCSLPHLLFLFIYLLKYIYTGYTHSVKYCYYNMALLIQYNTILHVYLVHTITNKMKIK